MMHFFVIYHDKLLKALLEHIQLVIISIILSLILAALLTLLCVYFKNISKFIVLIVSMIYSIPSLAMFALLIPLTGLGKSTAIIVLVFYNQYILLRSFLTGLSEVDQSITDAAIGMGMNTMQILIKIRIPLAKEAIFGGIRLAIISTIGIATIAASINAGGLGTILFDGLRTMNTNKIIWGSVLSAGLAIITSWILSYIENKLNKKRKEVSR